VTDATVPSGRFRQGSRRAIAYLGVGLPVIGVGFLATVAGLLAAVQYFAGVAAALCLAVLLVLTRARPNISPGLGGDLGGGKRP